MRVPATWRLSAAGGVVGVLPTGLAWTGADATLAESTDRIAASTDATDAVAPGAVAAPTLPMPTPAAPTAGRKDAAGGSVAARSRSTPRSAPAPHRRATRHVPAQGAVGEREAGQ